MQSKKWQIVKQFNMPEIQQSIKRVNIVGALTKYNKNVT